MYAHTHIYLHTYKYIFTEKDTTDLRASNGGKGRGWGLKSKSEAFLVII